MLVAKKADYSTMQDGNEGVVRVVRNHDSNKFFHVSVPWSSSRPPAPTADKET